MFIAGCREKIFGTKTKKAEAEELGLREDFVSPRVEKGDTHGKRNQRRRSREWKLVSYKIIKSETLF